MTTGPARIWLFKSSAQTIRIVTSLPSAKSMLSSVYPNIGIDPRNDTITVLHLTGETYGEDEVFSRDTDARSTLLPDFVVNGAAVFDAD